MTEKLTHETLVNIVSFYEDFFKDSGVGYRCDFARWLKINLLKSSTEKEISDFYNEYIYLKTEPNEEKLSARIKYLSQSDSLNSLLIYGAFQNNNINEFDIKSILKAFPSESDIGAVYLLGKPYFSSLLTKINVLKHVQDADVNHLLDIMLKSPFYKPISNSFLNEMSQLPLKKQAIYGFKHLELVKSSFETQNRLKNEFIPEIKKGTSKLTNEEIEKFTTAVINSESFLGIKDEVLELDYNPQMLKNIPDFIENDIYTSVKDELLKDGKFNIQDNGNMLRVYLHNNVFKNPKNLHDIINTCLEYTKDEELSFDVREVLREMIKEKQDISVLKKIYDIGDIDLCEDIHCLWKLPPEFTLHIMNKHLDNPLANYYQILKTVYYIDTIRPTIDEAKEMFLLSHSELARQLLFAFTKNRNELLSSIEPLSEKDKEMYGMIDTFCQLLGT